MVESISPRSFLTPNLLHASRLGKTSVPVRPIQSVYAQFKHIVGVPSRGQGATIPFSKLRHLDNLIDRLVKIRNSTKADFGIVKDAARDSAISEAHRLIQNQVMSQQPLFGGMFSGTGSLVNLVA